MSRVIEWVVISINTPPPPNQKNNNNLGIDLYFKIEVLGQSVNHA